MHRDDRISLAAIGLFAAAALSLANWTYQTVPAQRVTLGYHDFMDLPAEEVELGAPVVGGWPLQYYQRLEYPDAEPVTVWNVPALAANVLLFGGITTVLLVYLARRGRRLRDQGLSTSRITVFDLLVISMLIAGPFGYWQYLRRGGQQDEKLATALQEQGGVIRTAYVPQWIASALPPGMLACALRTRYVRLDNPSDAQVQTAVALPDLCGLRLGGGSYDLRLLDKLVEQPLLHDLRVAGRELDRGFLATLNRLHGVRSLNLMRTDINAEALSELDGLPRLQLINLQRSGLRLSELKRPPWAEQVVQVWLPHPDEGEGDAAVLGGWPRLQVLNCSELDTLRNSQPVSLRLHELPALERLELDLLQCFALDLENLPALKDIRGIEGDWARRLRRNQHQPGAPWFHSVRLAETPALKSLQFYGGDLRHLDIAEAGAVEQLAIGVFGKAPTGHTGYVSSVPSESIQAWIEGSGRAVGVDHVDLAALPLAEADLGPLAKNRDVTFLDLSQTGTTREQWETLVGMQQLRRISIVECSATKDDLAWFLETFPALEQLDTTMPPHGSLEIVDHPNLRTLTLGTFTPADRNGVLFQHLSRVRLEGVDQFKARINIQFSGSLTVADAPSLTGLAVHAPLPRGTEITGVRDLEYFAAGGPHLNNAIVRAVLKCPNLRMLTLAYPSAAQDAFEQLAFLERIEVCLLPGAKVADASVADLIRRETLRELDLSETAVTGATIRGLAGAQIETLDVGGTEATGADVMALTEAEKLRSLGIAGIEVSPEELSQLLQLEGLTRLDLSNTELTAEHLAKLSEKNPARLEELVLRNCTVDQVGFKELAKAQPQLKFDIDQTEIDVNTEVHLATDDRVLGIGEPATLGGMQVRMVNGRVYMDGPREEGRVDVEGMREMLNQMATAEERRAQ